MNSITWLHEHFKDQYTRKAQKKALRSRSWFKIEEINKIDYIFRAGMKIIDLGSAPGGWSLYVKNKIGKTGIIIACDILPMKSIFGVYFFQGNCTDINFLKMLFAWTKNKKVQVVLSDMSPNMTGISTIDINKSIYLGNLALKVCRSVLMSGGTFVVKIFQGIGFDEYLYNIRNLFHTVKIRKPGASRCCSKEVYIVAKEYKKFDI